MNDPSKKRASSVRWVECRRLVGGRTDGKLIIDLSFRFRYSRLGTLDVMAVLTS